MKTRVKYYQGHYYPQVKGLLFWKHILQNREYACFKTQEEAVEFISLSGWHYDNKVVWESKS